MTTTLLSMAAAAAVISILILLLLLFSHIFGHRFTAHCRYILWTLIILRLCIPIDTSVSPAMIEISLNQPNTAVVQSQFRENAYQSSISGTATEIPVSIEGIENTSDPQTQMNDTLLMSQNNGIRINRETVVYIITAVWAAGALFLFIICIAGYLRTVSRLRRTWRLPAAEQSDLCRRMGIRMGLQEKSIPSLYITEEIHSPMLCGFFRPVILLPDIPLTDNQLTGILAHELTHRRRGDLWIKLFCVLAAALHWYNPFVHIAAARCTEEMELSCDESLLDGMGNDVRVSYGKAMLNIIKRCTAVPSVLTTHFNPRHSSVIERFENILDERGKSRGTCLILLTAFLCITAGSLVAFRQPEKTVSELPYETMYSEPGNISETVSYHVTLHPGETFSSFSGNITEYTAVSCSTPDMEQLQEGKMPFPVRSAASPDVLYARYQTSYISEYTNIFAVTGSLITDGNQSSAYVYCKGANGWTAAELPAPDDTVCKGVVLRGIPTDSGTGWLLGLMADNGSIRFFRSEDGIQWYGGENVLHPDHGKSWLVQYSRHSGVGGETLCCVFNGSGWEKEQIWLSFDWGETFTEYKIPITETFPEEYDTLQYLCKTGGSGNGEYSLYFYAAGQTDKQHIRFHSSQGEENGTVSVYTYTADPHVRNMISEYRYTAPADNGGIFWNP